jgi:hypothetical protein
MYLSDGRYNQFGTQLVHNWYTVNLADDVSGTHQACISTYLEMADFYQDGVPNSGDISAHGVAAAALPCFSTLALSKAPIINEMCIK